MSTHWTGCVCVCVCVCVCMHWVCVYIYMGFPHSSVGKESNCHAGDTGSIPGSGISTGERTDYPFQYSGLENSTDYIVHGVAKSQTRLSDSQFHCHVSYMEVNTHAPFITWKLWRTNPTFAHSLPFTRDCYQANKEFCLWNTFLRNLSEKL